MSSSSPPPRRSCSGRSISTPTPWRVCSLSVGPTRWPVSRRGRVGDRLAESGLEPSLRFAGRPEMDDLEVRVLRQSEQARVLALVPPVGLEQPVKQGPLGPEQEMLAETLAIAAPEHFARHSPAHGSHG